MTTGMVTVQIKRLPHAPADLPAYATIDSAGMDIRYAGETITLAPAERVPLPTGFSIAIPSGYEGQIRLRSGFALRTGLIMPNSPGTIDSDYRGEVKVLVMNFSREPVTVESGERIAQLIIAPVTRCHWQEVTELEQSHRGSGGFGSTGRS